MFDWQNFIYLEYVWPALGAVSVVLGGILLLVLIRKRKRAKKLKPLQRPNRVPYDPDTFRR